MRASSHFGRCLFSFLPFLLPKASAGQLNVTIDDQEGDPTNGNHIIYEPAGAWNVGQNCTICTANPTPQSDAYLGTWMDVTFFPNGTSGVNDAGQIIQASVSFVGTAVYVICILDPHQSSEMAFVVDGSVVGSFDHAIPEESPFLFNQSVFSKTGLSNDSHTLQLQSGLAGQRSVVLLDAVIYTTDDGVRDADDPGTSTSSAISATTSLTQSEAPTMHKSRTGTIVGALVGAGVALLAALLFLLLRRRRRRRTQPGSDMAPYTFGPAPAPMMSIMANSTPPRADALHVTAAPDRDFRKGAGSSTPYVFAPTAATNSSSVATRGVPAAPLPAVTSASASVPIIIRSPSGYDANYGGEGSVPLPAYTAIDWPTVRSATESGVLASAKTSASASPAAPT